jgi:hypothetical protein
VVLLLSPCLEIVFMNRLLPAGLALALAAPLAAFAEATPETTALRQELAALRAAYEERLQALEQRLNAAEARAASPSSAPAPSSKPSAETAAAPPATPATAAGANAFNPALSLILSGLYTRTSQDPASYGVRGFQLPPGAEFGPGTRGFSLAETELGLAASIDPWLRGVANISLHPDDTVSVEEAFVQTTSLGGGLGLKAGRFFSGVGYLNAQHSHTWDFVDNPLAYQALLGTQYGDDGIQLTWLAPSDQFVELGFELGRGRSFPGGNDAANGAGMVALTAHAGGDVGDSHSWRAGLSMLQAKADAQALSGPGPDGRTLATVFSGNTRVWVADAIWKWAPNGNATRTSFKLQGEYLRSIRTGDLSSDAPTGTNGGPFRAVQSGWYLQGVYQFLPGWRLGLRTERLDAGHPDYTLLGVTSVTPAASLTKHSLMLDFSPSEFSRVRLQVARDNARSGTPDTQLFLQYQMSLGAHGAHAY